MFQNIMVPLDGSQMAECVLPQAKSIAMGCGVRNITFIRVVDLPRIPVVSETSSSGVQEKLERNRPHSPGKSCSSPSGKTPRVCPRNTVMS